MLLRALAVWALAMLVEATSGALRTLYLEPAIGATLARRVMILPGLALIFALAWACARWVGAARRSTLLAIGAMWACLTLGFELAIATQISSDPIERLASDYDLARGGLMGPALVALAGIPWAAARLRGLRPPSP